MKLGMLPRKSNSVCILTAALVVRKYRGAALLARARRARLSEGVGAVCWHEDGETP